MSAALSLLWWIAIGVFFFWMMSRGGCGMGHTHGHESDHDARHAGHTKPIDPVCGMEVDPANAAATRTVGGRTVFLCSQTCIEAFDKNPAMYLHRGDNHAGHHPHAGC